MLFRYFANSLIGLLRNFARLERLKESRRSGLVRLQDINGLYNIFES